VLAGLGRQRGRRDLGQQQTDRERREERDGERLRRFRLRTEADGVIQLSAPETGGPWRIERGAGPAERG
jgi:hypothetical protein